MKNLTIILILVLWAGSAKADEQKHKWNLTDEEKLQMAWAIHLLVNSGAISADENKCMKFDPDLIDELKKAGLIKSGDSKLMTVCIGSGK